MFISSRSWIDKVVLSKCYNITLSSTSTLYPWKHWPIYIHPIFLCNLNQCNLRLRYAILRLMLRIICSIWITLQEYLYGYTVSHLPCYLFCLGFRGFKIIYIKILNRTYVFEVLYYIAARANITHYSGNAALCSNE